MAFIYGEQPLGITSEQRKQKPGETQDQYWARLSQLRKAEAAAAAEKSKSGWEKFWSGFSAAVTPAPGAAVPQMTPQQAAAMQQATRRQQLTKYALWGGVGLVGLFAVLQITKRRSPQARRL